MNKSNNLAKSEGKWIFDDLYLVVHKDLKNNSYVYVKNKKAVIIDASLNCDMIVAFLKSQKIEPIAILVTHGHYDHFGETYKITNLYKKCKVFLHKKDLDIKMNYPTLDYEFFDENFRFVEGVSGFKNKLPEIHENIDIEVLETPGHTPGSVCFVIDKYIFTGDLIFPVDVGRTDSPCSDKNDMEESLKKFISKFKNKGMYLMPGHDKWDLLDNLAQTNNYVKKFFTK